MEVLTTKSQLCSVIVAVPLSPTCAASEVASCCKTVDREGDKGGRREEESYTMSSASARRASTGGAMMREVREGERDGGNGGMEGMDGGREGGMNHS